MKNKNDKKKPSIIENVLDLTRKAEQIPDDTGPEMPEEEIAEQITFPIPDEEPTEETPAPEPQQRIVYRFRSERVRRADRKESAAPAQSDTADVPIVPERLDETGEMQKTGGDTKEMDKVPEAAPKKESTLEFPVVPSDEKEEAKAGKAEDVSDLSDVDPSMRELIEQYFSKEELAKLDKEIAGEEASDETGEYVPNGAEAKMYDTGEIDYTYDTALPAEIPEEELVPPELDETDVNLMIAFGMDDESTGAMDDESAEKIEAAAAEMAAEVKKNKKKKNADGEDEPAVEYTSPMQRKGIIAGYKKKYRMLIVRIALCALLVIAAFLYENLAVFGGKTADVMNPRLYPVTYLMIDLQILFFGAVLVLKNVGKGFVSLFRLKPDPDSMTSVMLAFTLLYDVMMLVRPYGSEFRLYHFPMLLCMLTSLLYEFFTLRREIYSFDIASSKRPKFTVGRLDSESAALETEAFGDYLGENPSIFKINKATFLENFYKRSGTDSGVRKILLLLLPLALVLGIGFAMAGVIRLPDLYDGVAVGYTALMMAIPASSLLTFSFPFYTVSQKAHKLGSAIVGEGSLDEYASASSISFNDREVFPGNSVKVRSIKVFGNNRVDSIIYNTASVFRLAGGPLCDVFDIATADLGHSNDVRVLSVDTDGIEAAVGGSHLYFGKADYLRRNHYAPIVDDDDGQIGTASIMYVVMNDEVVAKMYIQYRMERDFEQMLRQLYKYGVCVGIQTFDPNIDDEMLSHRIPIQKYPVRVLKCREVGDNVSVSGHADSGIVSKHSAKNLLRTFTYCRKAKRMMHSGIVLNFIALFAVIPLMLLTLLFGGAHRIPSFWVALYQLFWMIAVMITPSVVTK